MDGKSKKQITTKQLRQLKKDLKKDAGKFAIKIAPLYMEIKNPWEDKESELNIVSEIKEKLLRMVGDLSCTSFRVSSGNFQVGYNFKKIDSIPKAYMRFIVEETEYYYV